LLIIADIMKQLEANINTTALKCKIGKNEKYNIGCKQTKKIWRVGHQILIPSTSEGK